jgi:hypothetical protein
VSDDTEDDKPGIAEIEKALWKGIAQSRQLAHEAAEVLASHHRRLGRIDRRTAARRSS